MFYFLKVTFESGPFTPETFRKRLSKETFQCERGLRWGPDLACGGTVLRGDYVGIFSHAANHRPSGLDVRISLYTFNQHSNWPVVKAVKYHIKFSE